MQVNVGENVLAFGISKGNVIDVDVTVDAVKLLLVSVCNVDILVDNVINTCQGHHHVHKHSREAHQRHQRAKDHRGIGRELRHLACRHFACQHLRADIVKQNELAKAH